MKKKSVNKGAKVKEKNEMEKNISETDYINIIIIHNIDENQIFTVFSIKKLFDKLKEQNIKNVFLAFHHLCNSPELFDNLKGKEYLGAIFFILLFVLEEESPKIENLKEAFLADIILLVNKLFLSKKLSNKDILLLAKFISFTSIHLRKEITQNNVDLLMSLSNKLIKYYSRLKLAIQIIIEINSASITYEFCKFLQKHFLGNKINLMIFTQKTDLLNLIFLQDEENKVLDFLADIYSFKYNRHFLDLFLSKINSKYDIKNKNVNTIDIFKDLNKTILFIAQLKEKEEIQYENDPYILNKSFYFTQNINNGIYLNNIQINNSLTIIFSFNFNLLQNKNKLMNKSNINKEYPIINLVEIDKGKINEKNSLSFFIKKGIFYFKNFFSDKKTEVVNIEHNQTYICHYSIKEKNFFSLQLYTKGKELINYQNKFTNELKKNMDMHIGIYNNINFEGNIGTIFLFKKYYEDIPQIFLNLKGNYDKALYYFNKDYSTNAVDIYDKIKNEKNNFIENKKLTEDMSKFLIAYITPLEQGQILKKLFYYNTTFIETKINCYKNNKICELFFYNNFSIFEFIKYEGLNYIVLLFELITSNIDNMNNDLDKLLILDLFRNNINLIIKVIDSININFFLDEIRCILFSLKKCIFEICNTMKLHEEMSGNLKMLINFLTYQDDEKKENNYIFIRNEIIKFLLNFEIYDLSNYSSMQYFFESLNTSLNINSYGLTSLDIFKKMMQFTLLYNQDKSITHTEHFKLFKHGLNDSLTSYLKKCDKLMPYNEIFKNFSSKYDFDYRNYQFFKIFYLSSENYFSNEENKNIMPAIKYIIDLYENLSNADFSDLDNSLKKEKNIIMALCIRFFLEYALLENLPKIKNKIIKSDINDKDKLARLAIGPNSKSLLAPDKDNLIDDFDFEIINTNNISHIVKNTQEKEKKVEFNDIIAYDDGTDSSNEHNSDNTGGSTDDKIIENDLIKINKKNSDENIISDNNNFNYYDYFELNSLLKKISSSSQFNDYCFKSVILFFLEKNNEIEIEQRIKYRFILKTKIYNDLYHNDYEQFLRFNYFNEETKEQLFKLLDTMEMNTDKIGRICYEILIYIIIKILKERNRNKCTFSHLISSRKICCKIFELCLRGNTEAKQTLINEFQNILNLIIPFHKNHFLFSFLFNCLKQNDLKENGTIFINQLLKTKINKEENNKMFYISKINCIIFLYRIIKSKDVLITNNFILDEKNLTELFDYDLFAIKYNILKDISSSIKKTYAEILFEILIYLYIKTCNKIYFNAINDIFISNEKLKRTGESKTILHQLDLDTIKSKNSKNIQINKILKNYDIIEDKYYSIAFFYKSLKYWIKAETNDLKNNIIIFTKNFFIDSNLIYKENNSKIKKIKLKNELYTYIKEILDEYSNKNKYRTANIEEIAINFKAKYCVFKVNKSNSSLNNQSFKQSILNFFNIGTPVLNINENFEKIDQNGSFSSCSSTKSSKDICKINRKKKMKIKKKKTIQDLNGEEENIINTENYFNRIINEDNIEQNENVILNEKEKSINSFFFKRNESSQIIINKFNLNNIESPNYVVLFPKLSLLEQIFATYFTDIFFYNEPFINMKYFFKYRLKKNYQQEISIQNFFNFPIITRNYIPKNLYFGGLFIKHDLNFFANRYFHISHPYFINRAKESKAKRIFPRVSDINDHLLNFIGDVNDNNNNKFIVDLVTNRSVYFGILIIGKHLIYFHKMDKEKYFKDKKESEEEKYLLCSPLCDYSSKNKKLFIFKKEITEIVNRRFLYSFQACEFYLKNGKSYYFNFYSEEKKIEFLSLFSNKEFNPYGIKIISDLKTEFKKKDFTNSWLNNKISTLEYLLFINKYSCRSYNDINQYPVFPWLRINGDKIRDLKNTIAAQTEDARLMLKEKYSLSSETFPYHYTTHYSNSSFLLYYLIRINPFTDNQITLQNNRFDAPARQFNSIDDLLKVLNATSQPREIIPEFFITTEFYYNYNCNFYGIKNNNCLINNLENKSGYDTPLDYILSNAVRLESTQCKSEINFFFDNIFGTGQMGGRDKCNTYDKYSYQEMIDLKMKIEQYKKKNLSLKEIKEKIDKKSNKIISFGQTPFKLLEDKHPQWIDKSENNKIINNNIIESSYCFSYPQKIIFIKETKNNNNKKYFYVLIHNPKEKNNNYELKFFEPNLKEDNYKSIKIQKKIKFLQKIKLSKENNNNYLYKYNQRLLVIDFNMSIFILGRFNDNILGLYNSKGESKFYLTESIISCLAKTSDKSFFSGHFNGKILEWKFNTKTVNSIIQDNDSSSYNLNLILDELIVHRKFIAHKEKISGLFYSDLLGLIISYGEDKKIMIRKYYDLTLLTMIDIGMNKFCVDIKISHCFLYILFFDELEQKHIVQVFSVNGIKVGEGNYNYINGFYLDKIGNVLIGNCTENKIEVYSPSMTRKLDEIILDNKIEIKNNKKIKKAENIDKFEKTYLIDFSYDKENYSLYSCFSNGQITKIIYKCNYE